MKTSLNTKLIKINKKGKKYLYREKKPSLQLRETRAGFEASYSRRQTIRFFPNDVVKLKSIR